MRKLYSREFKKVKVQKYCESKNTELCKNKFKTKLAKNTHLMDKATC